MTADDDITAPTTTAAPAVSSAVVPTGIKNPFAYNTSDNDQGLIPVSAGRLPPGIRLATVLILDNGDAIAALRLPGEDGPVFVRVDDLISVDFRQEPAAPKHGTRSKDGARSAAALTTTATDQVPVYLLIKSITATGVEVAPRVRPTEVHLIR